MVYIYILYISMHSIYIYMCVYTINFNNYIKKGYLYLLSKELI